MTNTNVNRTRSIWGGTNHVDRCLEETCKKFSKRVESAAVLARAISDLLVRKGVCTAEEAKTASHLKSISDGLTWISLGDDEICVVKKDHSFLGTRIDLHELEEEPFAVFCGMKVIAEED